MKINLIEVQQKKVKPDQNNLGFGRYYTDHMFVMDYEKGKCWINPTIMPYGSLSLEPSTMVFHYGQSVFEGLKAYLSDNNEILLFRPDKNIERMNRSNERLCIPQIDPELFMDAIVQLVTLDKEWIPSGGGRSLYIRPFAIATDASVGVHAAHTYKFMIILSPVGAYYPEGFNPVKIYVERKYVRAVKGGIGAAKTAGNYAASIKAQTEANEKGFTQVLWLDGVERKYIEEVGTMNVFFKIKNKVITPELNGSILEGVTRSSVIELVKDFGLDVEERRISLDEIIQVQEKGELEEFFGTGTAAVISPVGKMSVDGKDYTIANGKAGALSSKLYETLYGIQTGKVEDKFNWVVKV